MSRKFSGHAVTRAKNLYQAYVLLLLGIIFLLLAWLLHPSTSEYPIGVMMLGIGMAIAPLLNPYRLGIASWLTTLLGIRVFLSFIHRIPGDQAFPAFILGMGVALSGMRCMGR